MISRLRGILLDREPGEVTVDVGGVGYHAFVSFNTFSRLPEPGEQVELHVLTNLRDNALELFAFLEPREKMLFQILRGVSGVGPRLALSILSSVEADRLASVVAAGDVSGLTSVPGVGRKTAERLLVELKDKVEAMGGADRGTEVDKDAVLALIALGYKRTPASEAVRRSREEAGGKLENLIRLSLARLSA
ncbi:MAG: Holliday junction branch migration protein RuvA [Candidatus Binatia bacterium]